MLKLLKPQHTEHRRQEKTFSRCFTLKETRHKFLVPLYPLSPLSPRTQLHPPPPKNWGTRELAGSDASSSLSIIQARISPSFLPPSSVILPRPFYLSPPSEPPVLGEMKAGGRGGSVPTTTQRFHLLSPGPPASRKEGVVEEEGGDRWPSSCSDAAQHRQRYDTIRAYLFTIPHSRHVLQSDQADWGDM